MIICFGILIGLLSNNMHAACLEVRLVVIGRRRLRNIIHHRRKLAHARARVPYLEHDIKDWLVDAPRGATQYVEPCIHELDSAVVGRLFEVVLLLEGVFETHGIVWVFVSALKQELEKGSVYFDCKGTRRRCSLSTVSGGRAWEDGGGEESLLRCRWLNVLQQWGLI